MKNATAARVGFIGLGNIGRPMAERLLKTGHTLVVHNRSQEVVEAMVRQGASAARSPREVAERADLVLTCLPFPATVQEVYLGPNGLIEAARAGLVCIDHSTVGPIVSRQVASALDDRGVPVLDAPVSGGPEGAASGSLAIMVGGPIAAFERALPVLHALGKRVVHCGPSGAGSALKLVNQVLVTIHSVAAAEALALAERSEVNPSLALEVVSAGLGASAMLSRNGPRIIEEAVEPRARIGLMLKDLGLVRAACNEVGIELPVFFSAKQTFETAFEEGAGALDLAAVVGTVRRSALIADREAEPERTAASPLAH